MINYILSVLIGYLLGSINSSIIVSHIKGTDIRKHGSGNAGATNTLRTLGKGAAAVVTLADIAKGVIAVLIVRYAVRIPECEYLAAAGAVLGHNFPLYFGFKGGKGILTSFAVALVIQPFAALIALAAAILVMACFRYVSLGSIVGAAVLPIAALILHNDASIYLIALMSFISILAIIRHIPNIKRLISGTENKLSFGKKEGK